jgi:hypothetical protein
VSYNYKISFHLCIYFFRSCFYKNINIYVNIRVRKRERERERDNLYYKIVSWLKISLHISIKLQNDFVNNAEKKIKK